MWMIVTLSVTAVFFIFRGLRVLEWGNTARYLFALFCIFGAVVLSPEPMPLRIIEVLGYTIGTASAALMLLDICMEIYYRVKIAIFSGDRFTKVLPDHMESICTAMETMASRKIGALVLIHRKDSLEGHIQGGMPYESEVNAQILPTLFALTSPVHDGAVIVSGGRIVRVKTVLPIKTTSPISLGVGTRHRAAVGISEKTDAIVIVASEERGEISIAFRGELIKPASPEEFRALLLAALKDKALGPIQQQLAQAREEE